MIIALTQDSVWSNARIDAKLLQGFTRVRTESPETGRIENWHQFGRKLWNYFE